MAIIENCQLSKKKRNLSTYEFSLLNISLKKKLNHKNFSFENFHYKFLVNFLSEIKKFKLQFFLGKIISFVK